MREHNVFGQEPKKTEIKLSWRFIAKYAVEPLIWTSSNLELWPLELWNCIAMRTDNLQSRD